MDVSLIAFGILITVSVVGLFAELHLVSSLKDFYQATYVRAGSPTYSNLLSRYSWNWEWRKYILFRGFSSERLGSPALRGTFELAFWCSWVRFAAIGLFIASLFMPAHISGQGPNNSSKPTPLCGAA